MLIRNLAYRLNRNKLYYRAGLKMSELGPINVVPDKIYCSVYRFSMKMVEKKKWLRTAEWLIHRIPLNVRCELA
ncbi:hypothetical protein DSCA_04480 [Desulfosarcina alkanivorans]|uniref:Uncharacterized protein n=1 Tax=Desulfosarcina alkanivorans TaxID=571177 RepID=A0A5K7YBI2_9BACT|nr:hypothetical protein DSCA_04480 [Desulfosarcina alkanivorans]